MAIFRFRLEAADGSGHYRSGAISCDTEEEARMKLEARELDNAMYRLTTDELATLKSEHGDVIASALKLEPKAKMPGELPPQVRSMLALHRQAKPYKLVSLKEEAVA